MSNNKKKTNISDEMSNISNVAAYIYAAIMFSVYLIVMHDKYFDITKTRCNFFWIVTLFFVIVAASIKLINFMLDDSYSVNKEIKLKSLIKQPAFWMGAFLVCNVISFSLTYDKRAAFFGYNGRYMGLFTVILIAALFFVMYGGVKQNEWLFLLLLVTAAYSYVIAICQHMGNDFLGLREGVAKKQVNVFMSTFGNINIYAIFIVIVAAVAISMLLFSERIVYKIFAGIMVAATGANSMIANSDSIYFGLAAIFIILTAASIVKKKLLPVSISISLFTFGNLIMALVNRYIIDEYDKRAGISRILDNVKNALLIFFATLIIVAIVYMLRGRVDFKNPKRVAVVFCVTCIVLTAAVAVTGSVLGVSEFVFNYKWGNYRGFIWTKCVGIYNDFHPIQKLFGYGQETVKYLTTSSFRQEMLDVTGKVYDNAHNELLQYLLTIGIAGVISYVGLIVSSFVYILRAPGKNIVSYIGLAVIGGYFVQSLINISQPITTPLFFVIFSLCIGNASSCKKACDI